MAGSGFALMRTQVAIIGGGPSGLLLSMLLHRQGIDNVVIERRSREYVLSRIRAGVLERGTVELMRQAGVAQRLDSEGQVHDGVVIARDAEQIRIDFGARTGHKVVVYGQTELTRDLYDAREVEALPTYFNVEDLAIHKAESDHPQLTWSSDKGQIKLDCDYIAGCDGFHGISRQTIPESVRREYEKVYPFGWLGVLSETPPVHEELVYSSSSRGFALCSMRHENLSRYYVQCALTDRVEDWSDEAFWDELKKRIPAEYADSLVTGPSIEKSIAPLRSFVSEPMRWGQLFLCGDAAHIVPPTGAKGLNLATSDVYYLSQALVQYYKSGSSEGLGAYSEKALDRVWKAERFSWWMTNLLHRFPDQSEFDRRVQGSEFAHLRDVEAVREVLAINYVGLPY